MAPSAGAAPKTANATLLCVDLDGTLIRSDLLWECILFLLKRRPLSLFMVPYWLLGGKANLKRQVAWRATIDASSLPYRSEVLEFLYAEKNSGRKLALVSGSVKEAAQMVADSLGIFDLVLATEGRNNLKGKQKADLLREHFGDRGFDYVGDSGADLEVWQLARAGYVVGNQRLQRRAAGVTDVKQVFPLRPATFKTWVSALRGYHWFKNVLLFLPLSLAHRWDFNAYLRTAEAFVLFGMCASGIYVLNDLLDLHSDREHAWKQRRPFAAGEVPIATGLFIACALLFTALPCSFLLSIKFGSVLLGYTVLTMWYSLHLKRIVILDAFVLSSFYSIRIWAGSVISSIVLSHWFLSFSFFFFLSLAMAKRYSELVQQSNGASQSGRGYIGKDCVVLMNLGIASGFSAIVIFSLYAHSPEILLLYPRAQFLLLLAPILAYWLSRLWLKANRGQLYDDPFALALRDRASYAVAALAIVIIALSSTKPFH